METRAEGILARNVTLAHENLAGDAARSLSDNDNKAFGFKFFIAQVEPLGNLIGSSVIWCY